MNTYPSSQEPVDLLTEDAGVIFYNAASNWQRLANWIIDVLAYYLVLALCFVGLALVAGEQILADIETQSGMFHNLLSIATYVLFMTFTEGVTKGRSIGKWITRTRIITIEGRPITYYQAFTRSLVRLVPFEAISIFFAGFPWHDKWTKTQVIKSERSFM